MAAIKQLELQLPQFDMPEQFQTNLWDITMWNKYSISDEKSRNAWKARSNITENKFNFTLCKNEFIREELKYVMYYLYDVKDVTLTTFAEYYDRFKILSSYVENLDSQSLLDIKESDFEKFVLEQGNKVTVKNGSAVVGIELKKQTRKSRFVTFLSYAQEILKDYYTKDIPEREKKVWHYDKIPCKKGKDTGKTLDFRTIKNDEFLKQAQDFCYFLLSSVVFGTVYTYLHDLKIFFEWIENSSSEIVHLCDIDRDKIEDFFLYLRTSGTYSSQQINLCILNLKKFFEWGQLFEIENMPKHSLIITQDYLFKTKKDSRYLTDEEIKGVISIIPKIDNTYAKIIYILIYTGMRISEILELPKDSLKQNADGSYYLVVQQYKTEKDYIKPVDNKVAEIIISELKKNTALFGDDLKYVFVSDKNKPFTLSTINKALKKAIIENGIKGRDGKLLKCTTHRFRATLATKLIGSGKDPKLVAKLLGQSCVDSLSAYVAIDPKVAKEQLKPRLEKDQILISNIGKIDSEKEEIPKTAIPLCNGFCCKSIETGICKKASACLECPMFIPSKQFLNSYMLQLQETEASIAIAKACGYTQMLQNSLKTKESLENIISRLKELEEKKDEKH